MKVYKQIPRWWYLLVLVIAYGIAQATNYTGHSGMLWWTLTVLIFISFIFCALYGTLAAVIGFYEFTSSGTGFCQMITAYILPGQPVANMYGTLYRQHPMIQGIAFLQDLKLGQYVKLAPRVTFCMRSLWSGQNAQQYNSNAISWGALSPEMFGAHATYKMVPISLAIGVFMPFVFWIPHKIWPKVGFENFNTSVIMQYSCFLSVGINTSVNPGMVIGVFSQWFVRRRCPRWFTKYKYVHAVMWSDAAATLSLLPWTVEPRSSVSSSTLP
ncbi:hypothetical protein CERSUDRAFT_119755, partial [Gelatoporia subvermispora B]